MNQPVDLTAIPDDKMPEGQHPVRIVEWELYTGDNGNEAVKYLCRNKVGQTVRYTLFYRVKNGSETNYRFIKRLAAACGLTEAEQKQWRPQSLHNKTFMATVGPDDRRPEFNVVVAANPIPQNQPAPAPSAPMSVAQQTAAIAPAEREPGIDDDLPF